MTETAWPSLRRAWYVAGLLCLIAALSYLDRYIIALLADPIIRDMGIDATAIGLLIGLGFGLLYALSGVPVAYLIDRGTRVRIVYVDVGEGFAIPQWTVDEQAPQPGRPWRYAQE